MLKIKDWKEHQHYKHRNPPWIKLHRSLLDDMDWAKLTDSEAKMLVEVWLVSSSYDGFLPEIAQLSFRLRREEKDVEIFLNSLVKKGWLLQVNSNVLADCKTEKRRVEKEKSKEELNKGVKYEQNGAIIPF
jgi:hypothetical protein